MAMTLQDGLMAALISAAVSAVAIGGYERWIRQPRTPHLAVVDVGSLFAQVQQASSLSVIRTPAARAEDLTAAANFGPRLQAALEATARQCACTLVAMPAVFGASAGVPDLTALVRERLIPPSAMPARNN